MRRIVALLTLAMLAPVAAAEGEDGSECVTLGDPTKGQPEAHVGTNCLPPTPPLPPLPTEQHKIVKVGLQF